MRRIAKIAIMLQYHNWEIRYEQGASFNRANCLGCEVGKDGGDRYHMGYRLIGTTICRRKKQYGRL
jgi:hypothetical protein